MAQTTRTPVSDIVASLPLHVVGWNGRTRRDRAVVATLPLRVAARGPHMRRRGFPLGTGFLQGYQIGYAQGFADGVASVPTPGTTPPIITIISPTPGVAPGQPGGFPADFDTAKATPIVFDITGVSADLRYVCVTVRYFGGLLEEVVYRRGAFRGPYSGSVVTPHSLGGVFTTTRSGGWPRNLNGTIGDIRFAVDPIDQAGNLTP